jgi:RNase H-like domain found in reverse transcriptase
VFVSHALSDEATTWGIMELELYVLVRCVKNLSPYLLGREFIVKTDHKNLLYLTNTRNEQYNSCKLVRWRVILSEFHFVISHIPGRNNIVADALTRVYYLNTRDEVVSFTDSIPSIYCLKGKGMGPVGTI